MKERRRRPGEERWTVGPEPTEQDRSRWYGPACLGRGSQFRGPAFWIGPHPLDGVIERIGRLPRSHYVVIRHRTQTDLVVIGGYCCDPVWDDWGLLTVWSGRRVRLWSGRRVGDGRVGAVRGARAPGRAPRSKVRDGITERPILFRADMVRAILAGQKPQPDSAIDQLRRVKHRVDRISWEEVPDDPLFEPSGWYASEDFKGTRIDSPYGAVGDRLWVRETWRQAWSSNQTPRGRQPTYETGVSYRTDDDGTGRDHADGHAQRT